MKHICHKCGNQALWMYMPDDHKGLRQERFYCDGDCIPRGCSCNEIPNTTGAEYKDPEGRLLPCCEFLYNEDGFEE